MLAESEGVFADFSGLAEAPVRFEFGSGRTEGNVYLPVPAVRISGAFDDLDRAPGGCRVFPVDVNVVPHRGAEFVSLKVKVVDAAGNSVEQTTPCALTA